MKKVTFFDEVGEDQNEDELFDLQAEELTGRENNLQQAHNNALIVTAEEQVLLSRKRAKLAEVQDEAASTSIKSRTTGGKIKLQQEDKKLHRGRKRNGMIGCAGGDSGSGARKIYSSRDQTKQTKTERVAVSKKLVVSGAGRGGGEVLNETPPSGSKKSAVVSTMRRQRTCEFLEDQLVLVDDKDDSAMETSANKLNSQLFQLKFEDSSKISQANEKTSTKAPISQPVLLSKIAKTGINQETAESPFNVRQKSIDSKFEKCQQQQQEEDENSDSVVEPVVVFEDIKPPRGSILHQSTEEECAAEAGELPTKRLTESAVKGAAGKWEKIPIAIKFYNDKMDDQEKEVQAIKMEIDASDLGLSLADKVIVKHNVGLHNVGLTQAEIDDYATGGALTTQKLVFDAVSLRINAKDKLQQASETGCPIDEKEAAIIFKQGIEAKALSRKS